MTLFVFLSVVQGLIAAALVGIVLMQRSEGGGLGIGGGGGSPGGMLSARGAADFLTRSTKWLAVLFVGLAIVLAGMAVDVTTGGEIDDSLDRSVTERSDPLAAPAPGAPAPTPAQDDPLADVAE